MHRQTTFDFGCNCPCHFGFRVLLFFAIFSSRFVHLQGGLLRLKDPAPRYLGLKTKRRVIFQILTSHKTRALLSTTKHYYFGHNSSSSCLVPQNTIILDIIVVVVIVVVVVNKGAACIYVEPSITSHGKPLPYHHYHISLSPSNASYL